MRKPYENIDRYHDWFRPWKDGDGKYESQESFMDRTAERQLGDDEDNRGDVTQSEQQSFLEKIDWPAIMERIAPRHYHNRTRALVAEKLFRDHWQLDVILASVQPLRGRGAPRREVARLKAIAQSWRWVEANQNRIVTEAARSGFHVLTKNIEPAAKIPSAIEAMRRRAERCLHERAALESSGPSIADPWGEYDIPDAFIEARAVVWLEADGGD